MPAVHALACTLQALVHTQIARMIGSDGEY